MPLIAQDYWVSNLFGNTMYLMALSYYFVITFLGYNGTHRGPGALPEHGSNCPNSRANLGDSPPLPQPHGSPPLPHPSPGCHLVHQPLHLRLRNESGAGALVRRQSTKASLM